MPIFPLAISSGRHGKLPAHDFVVERCPFDSEIIENFLGVHDVHGRNHLSHDGHLKTNRSRT